MLIDELIRLGRPLLEGDMEPQEVLRLITDVEDERVKNFYRHVFVVELPADDKAQPRALPMQQFGDIDEDGDFGVNQTQALGAPFVLPSGGNPLNPQGRYGPPVYPCYDPHLRAFRESANAVLIFLRGRLERTPAFAVSEKMAEQIAQKLHERVADSDFGDEQKILGVLILARLEPDGFYTLAASGRTDRVGQTKAGQSIVPHYARILDVVWGAKVDEGREGGARPGPCSFSGSADEVISAYCKAWPWAFPTWTCPLPHGGNEKMLVEGIGLSPETYRALTLGACVFNKLTRRVSSLIVPEIFSPSDTRTGKNQAQRRKLTDLPAIYGSAFLLPIQDRTLDDPRHRSDFFRGTRGMLTARPHDPTFADRYVTAVTGFDVILPEGATDDYQLTLVYFSGDYTRGDVQLRAFIQDVVPSTLSKLRDLALSEARAAMRLLRSLMPSMSERQQAYLVRCYQSVPYLLARAYGGAYLWQQLEAVLHRRPLGARRVTANVARRLQSLTPQWPDSRFAMFDEVGFYLNFLNFLGQANHELAGCERGDAMPIRSWKELLEVVDKRPVTELERLSEPAELGFACGALIKRFSRMYYMDRRVTKSDADFLKDRVLTFGSDLRPAAIHDKALKMILELPYRLKMRKRSRKLEERVGAAIMAFKRLRDQIDRDKDDFVTAFWAGYALQGYDRPPKTRDKDKQSMAQIPE